MNDVGVTAIGAQSSAPSQMPSQAMMYNVNESLNAFLNSAHAMQADLQHTKHAMTSDTAMPCADCKPCSGFHSMFHPCTAFSCPVASPSSLTLHPSGDETCTATPRRGCNECWMEPCMSNVTTTPSETPSTTITEACPHPDVCTASMMAKGSEPGMNEVCCNDAHVDHPACTSPLHHDLVVCADDNCVVEDTVCHLEPDCDGCKDEHLQMSMANARVVPSCDPHVGQAANGCLSVCDGVLPPGIGRSTAKGKHPLHALGDQSCNGGATQGFDLTCTDAGCSTSVTDLQNIHKHFDPQQFEQHHHHTFASFDELLRCCCCSDLVLDQCCQFPEHDQSCANATGQDANKAWPSTGHVPHQHGHSKDPMAQFHALANGNTHDTFHQNPFPVHSAPSATKGPVAKSESGNKLDMGVFQSNSFMDFLGQHASSTPSDDHHMTNVEFDKAFASICGCPPTDGLGHAKKHPCRWEHCQETFDTHAALTDHIANDHVGSGKAQYECRWIGCKRDVKTFTQRQKVLRHLQTHTGDRPFECSICHKRFSEANTLAQHKRIHTREKPYVCDYPGCGKAFGVAGSLTIHKRTHTGEKPFKCSWPGCDRAFSESSNLTKHARIHTGERPFACTFLGCSKSFSRPDQLARHVKTHSKVKRHAHT